MPESITIRHLRERLDDHRKWCNGYKCLTCELGALVFSEEDNTAQALLDLIKIKIKTQVTESDNFLLPIK